jgi:hypothetical protein
MLDAGYGMPKLAYSVRHIADRLRSRLPKLTSTPSKTQDKLFKNIQKHTKTIEKNSMILDILIGAQEHKG